MLFQITFDPRNVINRQGQQQDTQGRTDQNHHPQTKVQGHKLEPVLRIRAFGYENGSHTRGEGSLTDDQLVSEPGTTSHGIQDPFTADVQALEGEEVAPRIDGFEEQAVVAVVEPVHHGVENKRVKATSSYQRTYTDMDMDMITVMRQK